MKILKSQAFKCIVVMLSVILICGGLLAVLSDLLKVSDDERIQRSIDKIYTGESVTKIETIFDANSKEFKTEIGQIKSCYKLSNGDYLVQSTGKQGYSNGTVTLDISIYNNNGVLTVKKAVLNGYTSQTLMSQLSSLYDSFTGSTDGEVSVVTGASMSSTATINAVKTALAYLSAIGG